MRVKDAARLGIVVGAMIGLTALGIIKVEEQLQSTAYRWAWLIVVGTTIVPLIDYLQDKQPITGPPGGFIDGLGAGLGLVLILAGQIL